MASSYFSTDANSFSLLIKGFIFGFQLKADSGLTVHFCSGTIYKAAPYIFLIGATYSFSFQFVNLTFLLIHSPSLTFKGLLFSYCSRDYYALISGI